MINYCRKFRIYFWKFRIYFWKFRIYFWKFRICFGKFWFFSELSNLFSTISNFFSNISYLFSKKIFSKISTFYWKFRISFRKIRIYRKLFFSTKKWFQYFYIKIFEHFHDYEKSNRRWDKILKVQKMKFLGFCIFVWFRFYDNKWVGRGNLIKFW